MFTPGHDARLYSPQSTGEDITITVAFSDNMDCSSITNSLSVLSTARYGQVARLDADSVACGPIPNIQEPQLPITAPSVYNYSIVLSNVHHGVHEIILNNASTSDGQRYTNVSFFLFFIFLFIYFFFFF